MQMKLKVKMQSLLDRNGIARNSQVMSRLYLNGDVSEQLRGIVAKCLDAVTKTRATKNSRSWSSGNRSNCRGRLCSVDFAFGSDWR